MIDPRGERQPNLTDNLHPHVQRLRRCLPLAEWQFWPELGSLTVGKHHKKRSAVTPSKGEWPFADTLRHLASVMGSFLGPDSQGGFGAQIDYAQGSHRRRALLVSKVEDNENYY